MTIECRLEGKKWKKGMCLRCGAANEAEARAVMCRPPHEATDQTPPFLEADAQSDQRNVDPNSGRRTPSPIPGTPPIPSPFA